MNIEDYKTGYMRHFVTHIGLLSMVDDYDNLSPEEQQWLMSFLEANQTMIGVNIGSQTIENTQTAENTSSSDGDLPGTSNDSV